jgi:hypothetical protein
MSKYHVYPKDDYREHNTEDGVNCWCKPTEDEGVGVHNALDGREKYEEGKGYE